MHIIFAVNPATSASGWLGPVQESHSSQKYATIDFFWRIECHRQERWHGGAVPWHRAQLSQNRPRGRDQLCSIREM